MPAPFTNPLPGSARSIQDRDLEALRALLRLANLPLAPRLTRTLLQHFNWNAEHIFAASDAELDAIEPLQSRHIVRLRDPAFIPTERQLRAMHRLSARVLLLPDPEYPPSLRDIPEPPPLLFVSGTLNERDQFGVAMVGSRQATPYGRSIAERFARELAGHGLTIVSGGAIGIDGAAHRGALDAGGRTLAILGCGLDVDYPREHRTLFEQIRQQGALITEYPPGAMPEAWRFPQRNRIVSGLTQGLLVVEAPAQSGALITARIAAEQGRTVMAVPGNIDRVASAGCNELLKEGATLVTCPEDVLRALNLTIVPEHQQRPRTLNLFATPETPATVTTSYPHTPVPRLPERQQRLLEALSLTPQHIDTLARHTGLSASEAGMELTLLEINGLARRMPGNTYIRTPRREH